MNLKNLWIVIAQHVVQRAGARSRVWRWTVLRLAAFLVGIGAFLAPASPALAAGAPTAKVDSTGTAVVTSGVGLGGGSYKVWMGCYDGGRCFFHTALTNGTAGLAPVLGSACFNWSHDSTEWVFFCDTYGDGGVTMTFGSGADGWSARDFGGWPRGVIRVYGGGGNDFLNAEGLDRGEQLYGQAGADGILGSRAFEGNVLSGGTENDTIHAGTGGNAVIRGGAGNDQLYGSNRWDRIEGDGGDDIIYGNGSGSPDPRSGDIIDGGTGNDSIQGGKGYERIDGGDGKDVIDVREVYCDEASGGAGDDKIFSSKGPSSLNITDCPEAHFYGNSGNDTIGRVDSTVDAWFMTLVGGEGNDILYANSNLSDGMVDCGDGTGDKAYIDGDLDIPEECETVYQ